MPRNRSRCRTVWADTPNLAAIADTALMQPVERLELIGQVHVLADHVLGKARLGSIYAVRIPARCRDGGALGDALLLDQQLEGGQPAPPPATTL